MCVWCYIWYAVVNIRHIVSHRICMPSIHIPLFLFLLLLHSIHQNLNVPCIKVGKGRKESEHRTLVVLVPIKHPLSIEHFDMQNAFCYPNWWNHCRYDFFFFILLCSRWFHCLFRECNFSFHSISSFTTKSTGSKTIRSFIEFYDLCTLTHTLSLSLCPSLAWR